MSTWEVVRLLHLLAVAFFVGGQLVMVAAIVPAFRGAPEHERDRLRRIARSFGWGSLVALGVLLATGAAMADEFVRWDDEKLQAKLGLVGLVTALILWHTRRPNQHWIEGVVFLVSLAITWLGVALAH